MTPDPIDVPIASALASTDAQQTEARKSEKERERRLRLLPRAVVVGLVSGLMAFGFRWVLGWGEIARGAYFAWAHRMPLGVVWTMLYTGVGASGAVWLVRRFAPEAAGSGIPHLEAVLRGYGTLNGKRVLPVKFLGGVLALGSGLVMGREGPTVQMGAAVADVLSGPLKATARERLTLLTAGAGAGLASAFNAPLSGLVFVLEEVQRDFRPAIFATAFVAAAVADVVARGLGGQGSAFAVPSYALSLLGTLPVFALLGASAGLLGVAFNRVLMRTLDLAARIPSGRRVLAAGLAGAVVGGIGYFLPDALGAGHGLTERATAGQIALAALPLWFGLRFLLTMLCYPTGAPGGVFMPLLGLGALLGLAFGAAGHAIAPGLIPQAGVFAVVGMAAYFTAIVRAPLTGLVLVVEMTGSYGQMLPLLVACFAAYIAAEALRDTPLYEALLERDLGHAPHAAAEVPA